MLLQNIIPTNLSILFKYVLQDGIYDTHMSVINYCDHKIFSVSEENQIYLFVQQCMPGVHYLAAHNKGGATHS